MAIEGVDVSNHQATFDFRGWQFAIIKSSEGNGFRDFRFAQHLAAARAAGLIVAAYHYQRGVSARSQFDLIRSIVPATVPVIIDVEDGSGPLSITHELIGLLKDAGYSVPLLYLPRWYWNNIGRPDLSGLPLLWGSDYRGAAADWSDYGGQRIALRQYTSTPFDKNWFGGTREDLARLLGGGQTEGDDDMLNEQRVPVSGAPEGEYSEMADIALGAAVGNARTANVKLDELNDKVEQLIEAVSKIATGGVDKEEIARIAKEAVGRDLNDNEE